MIKLTQIQGADEVLPKTRFKVYEPNGKKCADPGDVIPELAGVVVEIDVAEIVKSLTENYERIHGERRHERILRLAQAISQNPKILKLTRTK